MTEKTQINDYHLIDCHEEFTKRICAAMWMKNLAVDLFSSRSGWSKSVGTKREVLKTVLPLLFGSSKSSFVCPSKSFGAQYFLDRPDRFRKYRNRFLIDCESKFSLKELSEFIIQPEGHRFRDSIVFEISDDKKDLISILSLCYNPPCLWKCQNYLSTKIANPLAATVSLKGRTFDFCDIKSD